MAAFKSVGEYKKQEKILKFCLEKTNAAKKAAITNPGQSSSSHTPNIPATPKGTKPKQTKPATKQPKAKVETELSKNRLVKLATQNQRRQQWSKSRSTKAPSGTTKKKTAKAYPNQASTRAKQAALVESANLSQVPHSTPNWSQVSQGK